MVIQYPGSTSDIHAFKGMILYVRLEDGLLAPGLSLFGDNAYLNTCIWPRHTLRFPVVQWIHITFTICRSESKLSVPLGF
jgi:hypothetical protein